MKTLLNYFLRGMLLILPFTVTAYFMYVTVIWMNDFFNELLFSWFEYEYQIPGLGIVAGFILITFFGFLITRTFVKPVVYFFEKLLTKTPIFNIVYSSLKDLTEAFVGDRKKFNKPVYVEFSEPAGMKRFGFITEESLEHFGLKDEVAVYCPHSYNFSGNLYIVPREKVTRIKTDPTNFMRFVVSGGVTRIQS
ncbi:DUF502 domain-containing protein [Gracilimonas mengyeensis]|uniref:Uncharacterized membrane protein n=1 Tax=Gracilimonas mengyeensis TaxID=1302730 RepID=A0A521C1A0_9BACT|nr:DUF502 domain-containing protein [Gracilimonas mengyeensis]SMO53115.1 Uncharacterized membrane protein [Gracilimonas mengyeensis]